MKTKGTMLDAEPPRMAATTRPVARDGRTILLVDHRDSFVHTLGDAPHGECRAVDGAEHSDGVAGSGTPPRPAITHEAAGLDRRWRADVAAELVLQLHRADRQVMRVNMLARRNRCGGEADHLAVLFGHQPGQLLVQHILSAGRHVGQGGRLDLEGAGAMQHVVAVNGRDGGHIQGLAGADVRHKNQNPI